MQLPTACGEHYAIRKIKREEEKIINERLIVMLILFL